MVDVKKLSVALASLAGLAVTADGYKPLSKHGYLSIYAFSFGVFATELPLQLLAGQLALLAAVTRKLSPRLRRFSWLVSALSWLGLLGDLVDQRVFDGRQPAAHFFAALQQRQPLRGGQRVEGQVQGSLDVGLERVEHLDDLFPATRTHVRILCRATDKNARPENTETKVTQVVSASPLVVSGTQPTALDEDFGQQSGLADHQIVTGVDGNQCLHAAECGNAA